MNYELGMHCTGFEFSYCCVLPPYNSILAQVVKTQQVDPQNIEDGNSQGGDVTGPFFPQLLEGDPNVGLDFLGRPTVLRDTALDSSGHFKKYVLRYWHDAQPRNDGRGAPQTSTLISQVEGNSLLMWNTRFDAAATTSGNALIYGDYGADVAAVPPSGDGVCNTTSQTCTAGQVGNSCTTNGMCDTSYGHQRSSPKNDVLQGNGSYADPEDNYANAWLNHFYIYANLEGTLRCAAPAASQGTFCKANADCDTSPGAGDGVCGDSKEKDKIRLGLPNTNASIPFSTVVPQNSGPAFHPVGPGAVPGLENVLTFSGDSGTVVYTQMKVLENLPVMLTSPRIWEALGLPLDPFEDTINFFGDPGAINEQTLRPYVRMRAQLHNYDASQPGGIGTAVLVNGNPVIGTGDAPIDIPNCDRCHAAPPGNSSPNDANNPSLTTDVYRPRTAALVQEEYDFWVAYESIDTMAGDSDWYPRLKAAAISILSIHDNEHRTDFTLNYPVTGGAMPAVTRLGHESVLCQRCHSDNVIAVVKSADTSRGLIPPLTEALHNNHKDLVFDDSNGRSGACQGCHPAHRSDGTMTGYPITADGQNAYAASDNRDAAGGCFVGRDVHSNPGRDAELGVPTAKAHLNAVGQWLRTNVANDSGHDKGIWCTNCHSQLSQEIWAKENMKDLIHGVPGKQADGVTDAVNIRALPSLGAIASAVGVSLGQAEAWLDPSTATVPNQEDRNNAMAAIWNDAVDYPDANVATIEVSTTSGGCSTGNSVFNPDFGVYVCISLDPDGDPSVRILDFCTTPDCVAAAQSTLDGEGNGSIAAAVPFQAADDARDHWLAPGEPHCADCHQAPYTEQSGNINFFPPFNYPRKASLFRYSRGHQDITCQGCHESTHGLYPVTAPGYVPGSTLAVDETTWEQAAGMNTDGSHGPLKCGACHMANSKGVAVAVNGLKVGKTKVSGSFDAAVDFAHSFTSEDDPRQNVCVSCHKDQSSKVSSSDSKWLRHASTGEVARDIMDKVEISQLGHVSGDSPQNPLTTVCTACHKNKSSKVSCSNLSWKRHLPRGDVSQKVWEAVSTNLAGSTCGF